MEPLKLTLRDQDILSNFASSQHLYWSHKWLTLRVLRLPIFPYLEQPECFDFGTDQFLQPLKLGHLSNKDTYFRHQNQNTSQKRLYLGLRGGGFHICLIVPNITISPINSPLASLLTIVQLCWNPKQALPNSLQSKFCPRVQIWFVYFFHCKPTLTKTLP